MSIIEYECHHRCTTCGRSGTHTMKPPMGWCFTPMATECDDCCRDRVAPIIFTGERPKKAE